MNHLPDLSIGHSGKLALEYQGWSTGGVAERASKDEPAARSIAVLLNPNDDTISNPQALELVDAWSHGAARLAARGPQAAARRDRSGTGVGATRVRLPARDATARTTFCACCPG
ncbi:MAG: hypothetical protein ACRDNP_08860 [Gaiellaceae bacterium]